MDMPAAFTLLHGGVTFQVVVTTDDLTNPHEEGSWSVYERSQFNAGNWRFVTLTVTPFVAGVSWDMAAVDVCGVPIGECLGEWVADDPSTVVTRDGLATDSLARLRDLFEQAAPVIRFAA